MRLAAVAALALGCAGMQVHQERLDDGGGAGLWIPPPGVYLAQAGQSSGNNFSTADLLVLGTLTVTGALLPASDNAVTNGSTSRRWSAVHSVTMQSGNYNDSASSFRMGFTVTGSNLYRATQANSGANYAHIMYNSTTLGGGTFILGLHNDNSAAAAEFSVHNSGKTVQATTDSTGAPGAATITTPTGRFSIGAGAGAAGITITSNTDVVTTSSIIHAVLQTADGSCTFIKSVVPGAGSFVVTTNANCTGTTNVGFIVFN